MPLHREMSSLEAAIILVTAFEELDLMMKEKLPRNQIFGAFLLFNRLLRRCEAYIPNNPEFGHVHRLIQEVRSLSFSIHDHNRAGGGA